MIDNPDEFFDSMYGEGTAEVREHNGLVYVDSDYQATHSFEDAEYVVTLGGADDFSFPYRIPIRDDDPESKVECHLWVRRESREMTTFAPDGPDVMHTLPEYLDLPEGD